MIKKLIALSIKNTSLNHILFVFLLIFAYVSYTKIAKEMFPPSALDTIVVKGFYQGSSSSVLEKLIVQDIEDILHNNQNLQEIKTLITNANFHISAALKNSNSKEEVISDIKSQIDILKADIPSDMDLPTVQSVESFFPLMSISVSSNTNDTYIEVAKTLAHDIRKLKNLYSVDFDGEYEKILVISLNEQRLIAYNISKEKAYKALKELYSLNPMGFISSSKQKYYIEAKNYNIHINTILNSEIKIDNQLIFVKDIASIHYDYESKDLITRTNAATSVSINIKNMEVAVTITSMVD